MASPYVNNGGASEFSSTTEDDIDSTEDIEPFTLWSLLSPRFYLSVIWNTIHSATFASVFVILLMWASIFIYITFYFLYIPSLDLSRSIHFQFDADCDAQSVSWNGKSLEPPCRHPAALIPLGQYKSPTLFAKGQQYRIRVDLSVPDSEVNHRQGMFMVKLVLMDAKERTIVSSSRPAMITFRSHPVKLIHTFFNWPFYVIGVKRESEDLHIPLVEEYIDGTRPNHGPASIAKVTIIARDIQIYSAVLTIQANLTGLRHYMVNWPILTALFGIATIFAFLALITICSINRVVKDDTADTEILFPGEEDSRESATPEPDSSVKNDQDNAQSPDSTVLEDNQGDV